jgi:hypothetical protein
MYRREYVTHMSFDWSNSYTTYDRPVIGNTRSAV